MTDAPVMPLYTDAYISDTMHLTCEQHGAYLLILMATWRNNGNPLPDDDTRLARICRVSPRKWRASIRPVLVEFFDISDGSWRQKRLQKIFKHVAEKIETNRLNAARGGKAKARKTNNTGIANATNSLGPNSSDGPSKNLPIHEPYSSVSKDTDGPRPVDPAKRVYDLGKSLLSSYGISKSSQGGLITGWRKRVGDSDLLVILTEAGSMVRDDIVAYVNGSIRARPKPKKTHPAVGTPEWEEAAKKWGYQ